MEGSDILLTLAEVAIALTGFTGIVIALGTRAGAEPAPLENERFRILLAASLAALFFSLFPFLLHHVGLSAAWVWRTCSASVALFLIPVVLVDTRSFLRSRDEIPAFERRAAPVIAVLGVTLWMIQVANVVWWRAFGPYLAAPLWFIAFSAMAFVRLLLDLRGTRR